MKCDGTFCIDIRITEKSLGIQIKLISEILCAENSNFPVADPVGGGGSQGVWPLPFERRP